MMGCGFFSVAVLILSIKTLNAVPTDRVHGDSTIEFYSFEEPPYFRIRSRNLHSRDRRQTEEQTSNNIQEVTQNQQPLDDVSAFIKDYQNVYAEIQQIEKEQQAKLQIIDELKRKVIRQGNLIKRVKEIEEQQDSRNSKRSQDLNAQDSKLQRLNPQNASIKQIVNGYKNMIEDDPETVAQDSIRDPKKVVVEREEIKGTLQDTAKNVNKIPVTPVTFNGSGRQQFVILLLREQIEGLDQRIQELEKELHDMLKISNK